MTQPQRCTEGLTNKHPHLEQLVTREKSFYAGEERSLTGKRFEMTVWLL